MDTIVLTASAGAFPGLATALADIPAVVRERPLLSFSPPLDWGQLDAALARRHRYRALALTSPRAAHALVERIDACKVRWGEGTEPAVWAVGVATLEALQGRVGHVRRPEEQPFAGQGAAAALARAMLNEPAGGPVLFPCGDRRRDELPHILRSDGIEVDEVVCYRTVLATLEQARLATVGSTVLVVASPSVVGLLTEACRDMALPRLVAIGETTAAAARAAGWSPAAVASEPSTSALVSAISGLLAPR